MSLLSHTKRYAILAGATIITTLTLSACNIKALKEEPRIIPGSGNAGAANSLTQFAATGSLCGTSVAFDHFDTTLPAHPTAGRPFAALAAVAVCGAKTDRSPGWKALASSLVTAAPIDRTAAGAGIPSTMYVDAKGKMSLLHSDGTLVAVGKFERVEHGYPLSIKAGGKADITVDGEPFDLAKDRKDQAGRELSFVLP